MNVWSDSDSERPGRESEPAGETDCGNLKTIRLGQETRMIPRGIRTH